MSDKKSIFSFLKGWGNMSEEEKNIMRKNVGSEYGNVMKKVLGGEILSNLPKIKTVNE